MNNIYQIAGHTFDLSIVEHIGPIEKTTATYSDDLEFYIYLRSIAVPVTMPKRSRKLLEEKHADVTQALFDYHAHKSGAKKHYLIQWIEVEYAKHESQNDYEVSRCMVEWLTDTELETICRGKINNKIKVTHLG